MIGTTDFSAEDLRRRIQAMSDEQLLHHGNVERQGLAESPAFTQIAPSVPWVDLTGLN